ncbi:MAG: hypothetical protein A3F74_06385 [Betaproteobacteria bacterium RIFCSPLOWO2_12_FULL_62_58]|nr:MAG: hypothetical protein A3F74_06385 [Betaproteobacteria bacterium RIFCSPLOWO2_12_FULL_62_58]
MTHHYCFKRIILQSHFQQCGMIRNFRPTNYCTLNRMQDTAPVDRLPSCRDVDSTMHLRGKYLFVGIHGLKALPFHLRLRTVGFSAKFNGFFACLLREIRAIALPRIYCELLTIFRSF